LFASLANHGSLLTQGTESEYHQAPLGSVDMGRTAPGADLE